MPSTRSSTRLGERSSPASSQGTATTTGSKRKSEASPGPKPKRGRKSAEKKQKTIEETLPDDSTEGQGDDVEMKNAPSGLEKDETHEPKEATTSNGDAKEEPKEESKEEPKVEAKESEAGADEQPSKPDESGNVEPTETNKPEEKEAITSNGDAVEASEEREKTTPSSILEKGIIYFFFRGRVGIDEPSEVDDIARTYIVLRPLPHGAKLGDGPIGDDGKNRVLALPKKVLPVGPQDRFMVFVEKANSSIEDIKSSVLTSADYDTKTAGSRHTPAATPIGEGVYAITTTGRETHLAYLLTIPSELSEVQRDIGLQEKGSFVTSLKNPQHSGPANATLPQGPDFPKGYVRSPHLPPHANIFQNPRRIPYPPLDAPRAQASRL